MMKQFLVSTMYLRDFHHILKERKTWPWRTLILSSLNPKILAIRAKGKTITSPPIGPNRRPGDEAKSLMDNRAY